MSLVTQTPTNPAISPDAATVAAGNANAFRPALNTYVAAVEDKAQLVEAFLEQLTAILGNGAVSGGTISAGAGLSVSIAALSAIVGNIVVFNATQTVGGLTASQTNSLFLRQDGTWTKNTTGAVPTDISTHGAYLLWGTATTDGSGVTGVSNVRDFFRLGSPLRLKRRAVTMTDADITLSSSQYDGNILELSGTLTAGRNVILPLTDGAFYIVNNLTGQTLTFKGTSGTGVAVATVKVAMIYTNGTNFYRWGADVSP